MIVESGFSFAGKHCSEFGLRYIPDRNDRFPSVPDFSMIDTEVTGRAGGYVYGTKVSARTFDLDCFYEDLSIEQVENIIRWISREQKGRLVFDDRPWVYYDVYVSAKPTGTIWEHDWFDRVNYMSSGQMTLHFKAYSPFGCMAYKTYNDIDIDGAAKRSGIVEAAKMPPAVQPQAGTYLLYNPGTEYAYTRIEIGGTAPNGVSIYNSTTNERCSLVSLPEDPNYLVIDADYGYVKELPTNPDGYAYEYHNDGYIRLAPCIPYDRDVIVRTAAGSANIAVQGATMTSDYTGRYIWLGGAWRRILTVRDGNNCIIDTTMTNDAIETTMITVMNTVSISGEGMELSRLTIDYVPQIR